MNLILRIIGFLLLPIWVILGFLILTIDNKLFKK